MRNKEEVKEGSPPEEENIFDNKEKEHLETDRDISEKCIELNERIKREEASKNDNDNNEWPKPKENSDQSVHQPEAPAVIDASGNILCTICQLDLKESDVIIDLD